MSLNLYITSKTPVLHRGTGIYIRENGETKELETKQEVLKYFPDVNPEDIEENSYEDDEYFRLNLTHNLTDMALECKPTRSHLSLESGSMISLYDLIWHPKDNLGIEVPNMEYLQDVTSCYKELLENAEFFKKYNPDNGWGSYEQLLKGVKKYLCALQSISDDFENYTIEAST